MGVIKAKGTTEDVLVDDEFMPLVSRFKWRVYPDKGYAVTSICGHVVPLHRLIMGAVPRGYAADHINRNRLDNRLCNLRPVTPQQNKWNSIQKNNSTGFPGVTQDKRTGKYHSRIITNGQIYYTGSFLTPQEASAAREAKARELFGEFYPGT